GDALARRPQCLAVDTNVVLRAGALTQYRALAVDRDAPGGDQLLGLAPTGDACARDETLQTLTAVRAWCGVGSRKRPCGAWSGCSPCARWALRGLRWRHQFILVSS